MISVNVDNVESKRLEINEKEKKRKDMSTCKSRAIVRNTNSGHADMPMLKGQIETFCFLGEM